MRYRIKKKINREATRRVWLLVGTNHVFWEAVQKANGKSIEAGREAVLVIPGVAFEFASVLSKTECTQFVPTDWSNIEQHSYNVPFLPYMILVVIPWLTIISMDTLSFNLNSL